MLIYKIHWEVYEFFGIDQLPVLQEIHQVADNYHYRYPTAKNYLEFPPGFFIIFDSYICVIISSYPSLLPFFIQVILTDEAIILPFRSIQQ